MILVLYSFNKLQKKTKPGRYLDPLVCKKLLHNDDLLLLLFEVIDV